MESSTAISPGMASTCKTTARPCGKPEVRLVKSTRSAYAPGIRELACALSETTTLVVAPGINEPLMVDSVTQAWVCDADQLRGFVPTLLKV